MLAALPEKLSAAAACCLAAAISFFVSSPDRCISLYCKSAKIAIEMVAKVITRVDQPMRWSVNLAGSRFGLFWYHFLIFIQTKERIGTSFLTGGAENPF